jgi:ring-1,2-phenylacetyl-CoA epoxidase subunit PaaC
MQETDLFKYCLHLGDNALILAQRNSGWCGHGPVLEQDIAITNITLDLLGQARNFYQYAANIYNGFDSEFKGRVGNLTPRLWKIFHRELNEDDLAFLREERQFLNLLICELPRGDWALTILRQFFFSSYQYILFEELSNSKVEHLSAIAEKSLKEVTYHQRWSSEWVIRLGDGTHKSRGKMEKALEELWPYTMELFTPCSYEENFITNEHIEAKWLQKVSEVLEEATLDVPATITTHAGGKIGNHTEHMGYILPEMQHIQRAFPNQKW